MQRMSNDDFLRAVFGLLWAWPCMWVVQRTGLRPLPASLAVTVWMIPGWLVYRVLAAVIG